MSLSSSLFTGTSGLRNMGNALQVVGNNISNLNTIGFKKGRATFADTLYESVSTQAGADQIGRGMALGDVSQNFGQGSFESTGNATDLSIGGNGFFIMRQANSENTYYTRAGNFYFDKNGQFVNPEGYVVQGWALDEETGTDVGAIGDVVLDDFTSPPKKSTSLEVITNLDADATSQAVVLSNLFDASETPTVEIGDYEYQTSVKVYDSLGSTHDITIIYDKKNDTEWEYIVTMNPEEDKRNLVQGTDSKGLLARGTVTFSKSSGKIVDFTMSEMTGRLGNFTANGINTTKDVDYQIVDYDAVQLDGYGFELEFDGTSWSFADQNGDGIISAADLPDNYPNAKIVKSDGQNIDIVLDPANNLDVDPDLRIKLAQPAVATDSIGFDINKETDLHEQGISGTTYTNDTANDNTMLHINEPGVMNLDADDLGISWNPQTETWHWVNPVDANSAGTLVTNIQSNNTALALTTNMSVVNPEDVDMVLDGMQLRYNDAIGSWDWNQALKEEDFTNNFSFTPTNDPVLSIVSAGTNGAMASTDSAGTATSVVLGWVGSTSSWAIGAPTSMTGNTGVSIDVANSSNTQVQFYVWDSTLGSAGASVARYTFGTGLSTSSGVGTIQFSLDPTPPAEYKNAVVTTTGAATNGFSLNLDGDTDSLADITFNVTAGGGTVAAGDTFSFNLDPDTPPAEYVDATLKGDKSRAVIDLDGSGNEDDKEDIVFEFKNDLTAGISAHPFDDKSTIAFDIKGSTVWRDISKEEIQEDGYFSFTTDFLGGDFGSTETAIQLDIGTMYDGNNFINSSLTTTQFSKSSATVYQDADGYAAGDLETVTVAADGVMTGVYSNGQLIPLFRVGLAKFQNNYGLSNTGGNLFMETRESGGAITNKPGENGLGKIAPNSLEMSNVDISEEFVNMIIRQRGFQANSKTVTTTDSMMETVIQMKR